MGIAPIRRNNMINPALTAIAAVFLAGSMIAGLQPASAAGKGGAGGGAAASTVGTGAASVGAGGSSGVVGSGGSAAAGGTSASSLGLGAQSTTPTQSSSTIGTGGAIVMQSDHEAEYQEIMLKARALINALAAYAAPDGEIHVHETESRLTAAGER